MICFSSWVSCNAVHQPQSFEPVLLPAPNIIVRLALSQTLQHHLILMGNTEVLHLSLLHVKATMTKDIQMNFVSKAIYSTFLTFIFLLNFN